MIHIYDTCVYVYVCVFHCISITCNVPGLRQGATLLGRWLHLPAGPGQVRGWRSQKCDGHAGDVKKWNSGYDGYDGYG